MPGNVYIGDALVEHVSALAEEAIDRTVHRFLVPWYRSCRQNDGIARLNTDQAMILVGNACEGRGWLSLAASTDYHYLLRIELIHILGPDEHSLGTVKLPRSIGIFTLIFMLRPTYSTETTYAARVSDNL